MSVSTTEVGSAAVRDLLRAYDLHHSGSDVSELESQHAQHHMQPGRQQDSPLWWPTDRRRVPPYRAPSRDHRLADRPAGRDNVEGILVTVMFIGVFVNSAASKLWRQTGGRINDKIFHYEIGGDR